MGYSSNKKEQIINTLNNLDGSQGNYAEWKKSISKGYVLYDSIYMKNLKLQEYSTEVRDVGPRRKWIWLWRVAKRESCGDDTALYFVCGDSYKTYLAGKSAWNYTHILYTNTLTHKRVHVKLVKSQ